MRITVFGGSAPLPDTPAYQEACVLGQRIGQRGFTVLTGGYIGTMEAVSRGCNQAGGHVIGVTCDQIEAWRDVRPNRWVKEEIRKPTINERLLTLIDECDAAIALPGGVGTLAEVAVMWNLMQTAAIPARPLVLIGSGWQKTFSTMLTELAAYTPPAHRDHLLFAPDALAGFEILEAL